MNHSHAFDELTKALTTGSRREILTRAIGAVTALLVVGLRPRRASAAPQPTFLREIPFGKRKFCIYSEVGEKTTVATTCSVIPDEPCLGIEECAADPNVGTKLAKSDSPQDTVAQRSDGQWCRYSSKIKSVHHTDGTFFCSTVIACGEKGVIDRASCLGTPDPDKPGHAICPGLSECFSDKKRLPRTQKG